MIDIENKVIDTIDKAFSDWEKPPRVVSSLPQEENVPLVVYVRMIDNSTYQASLDQSLVEHHARISFRIECYSNAFNAPRENVKEMLQVVDYAMQSMKFTRTSYGFIPNYDPSYVRAYADYYAIVQQGKYENGTTTHRMYRQ